MLYGMVGSQTTSTARALLSGAKKALKCPLMFEVEVQRQICSSRHEKGGNSVTNHRYITFSLDEWTERIARIKLSKYSMNPHLPWGWPHHPAVGSVCVLVPQWKGNTAALPLAKSLQDVQNLGCPNKARLCSTLSAILVVWSREKENSTVKSDAWTWTA